MFYIINKRAPFLIFRDFDSKIFYFQNQKIWNSSRRCLQKSFYALGTVLNIDSLPGISALSRVVGATSQSFSNQRHFVEEICIEKFE